MNGWRQAGPSTRRVTAPAIADYGLIGDTRTAALSSPSGSIDWLCLPRFDSDCVFARLVGGDEAGCFSLGPADPARPARRRYRAGSAVLETTWHTNGAELTLTEAMVAEVGRALLPATLLVRRLESRGGVSRIRLRFDPRRGPERRRPRSQQRNGGLVCDWGDLAVALHLDLDPTTPLEPGQDLIFALEPGRPLTAVLAGAHREPLVHVRPDTAWEALCRTDAWWRGWTAGIDYSGPFRDAVSRSLLTLRLLTYSPSGAPVAAPTTSLPEELGGARNWDYRYAWPRDASIGIAAFLGVGKIEEARAFLYWLLHASRLDRPRLPALLTLDGRRVPHERVLDDWPGYAGSRPVRFGNGARDQHQLDGYGWVLDAGWLLARAGHRLYGETWRALSGFADLVAHRWREPDAGIWEVRGEPRHYVHSKLMGWLALDRALRIAATHPTARSRRQRWEAERTALGADIVARGFDPARNTFVRAYGSADLDAALLLLPLLEFDGANATQVEGTVEAVWRELGAGGPLLHRYPPGFDGLAGGEGVFLPCSFWLVQALARLGRVEAASAEFARLLACAGELGLFAEELDPATGTYLGNYPQALTHAALVQAAFALRDAMPATRP